MAKGVVVKSISFDPELFEKMETRRGRLLMQRSEYLTRLIVQDLVARKSMDISEIPADLLPSGEFGRNREYPTLVAKGSNKRNGKKK